MDKGERKLRSRELSSISQKFIPDDLLRDTPAILFRKILREMEMDPQKWVRYLRDYLDRVIDESDPVEAKKDRLTKTGNIKETYFQKPGLTFSKLLEGLTIVRMRSVKITIEATDEDGNKYTVDDTVRLLSKEQMKSPVDKELSKATNAKIEATDEDGKVHVVDYAVPEDPSPSTDTGSDS